MRTARPARTKALAACAIISALAASAIALRSRGTHDTGGGSTLVAGPAPATAGFRFDWPRGSSYVYGVTWRSTTRAQLEGLVADAQRPAQPLDSEIDVTGELVLRSYGMRGEVYILAVELRDAHRTILRALGQSLVKDEAEAAALFRGREAYVEVDTSGAIVGIDFKPEDPPLFKHVMQSLVTRTQVTVPAGAGAEWQATEAGPNGKGDVRYRRAPSDPLALTRDRTAYASVTSLPVPAGTELSQDIEDRASVRLDSTGHVVSLLETEAFTARAPRSTAPNLVARSSFSLERRSVGTWAAPTTFELASWLERRKPGEIAISRSMEEQHLDQLAAAVPASKLTADLERYASGGTIADQRIWFTRGSARLKLEPELCALLAARATRPDFSVRGRAMTLDLLASAGSPVAQAAMRSVLSHDAIAHGDEKAYATLLQRFTLLAHPDSKSAAFLARVYGAAHARSDAHAEYAAAYALGATAGKLVAEGRRDLARGDLNRLRADLEHARTTVERRELVTALGNAALEENVEPLRGHAEDESADVRAAVASALANVDTAATHATLLALVRDSDDDVQRAAVHAMERQTIGAADLAELATRVTTGEIRADNYPTLTTLLVKHTEDGEPTARMLRYMLAHADDGDTEARVRALLEQSHAEM